VKSFAPTLYQHLATDTARNLVVTAGAGTGKTEVLTRRIIKILRQEKLAIDRLMVVTFTDKAAVEMKERIYAAIEAEIERSGAELEHFKGLRDRFLDNRISTFHAFCAGLLREYPIEAEIDPYFRVMDEVDKVFFLRRVINRSINRLAEDKRHPELTVLSREWSRTALANTIYSLIQKREQAGPWLRDFSRMEWEQYSKRLPVYRRVILREICYKTGRSGALDRALELLQKAQPDPPEDDSALSRRRLELLALLPQLQALLLSARGEDVDIQELTRVRELVSASCKLSGAKVRAWADNPEGLDLLREGLLILRHALKKLALEDFQINRALEAEAFCILKALASVALTCLQDYRREKLAENFLDFQDLQLKVLALLKGEDHRHIVEELRSRYLYIMVDEFQDTNDLQWEIVRAIASDGGSRLFGDRLFIVGDEKQAIYSFRGGDVSLFARVRRELLQSNQARGTHQTPFELYASAEGGKDYTAEYGEKLPRDQGVRCGEIVFVDNFRSAQEPITFFNLFFQALLEQFMFEDYEARPQRLLCAGNRRRGSVELLLADRKRQEEDEALAVVENEEAEPAVEEMDMHAKEAHLIALKIKEVLLGDDPLYERVRTRAAAGQPAIAILLNRRTKLKVYEEALRRESIDFIVVRGRGFYQRQEIMDLGNLLGFLADRSNSIFLAGFLRSAVGHASDEGIYLLSRLGGGESLWDKLTSLFEAKIEAAPAGASGVAPAGCFSAEDYASLKQAHASLTRWLELCRRMVLVDFLHLLLDEGGYFATLSRGRRGAQAVSNIEKLLGRVREVSLSGQEDFLDFAQWLNERIDYIDEEGEADVDVVLGAAVQLMTVHQSKGLEFPMVFVPDLNAAFNFGEQESVRFADITEALSIQSDPESGLESFLREDRFELGIDAPDPDNNWAPTPTLVKRIIQRRNREKTIAERKRLLYVAATRAMDHLVLVGQPRSLSRQALIEERSCPLNEMTNWMGWISKILSLTESLDGESGTVLLGDPTGEHLQIPYRLFDESRAGFRFEGELRTEFPGV
jgi:ATP-dependent helicase/nuclease subunit A